MKEKVKKLIEKGFFHIFGANVINKIIGFASSFLLVRILSKEDYGLYSYAENILLVFLLVNSLGVPAGLLQYGSSSIDSVKKKSYFNFGVKFGVLFNLIVSFIILIYALFILNFYEARPILISMSFLPLLMFIFQATQMYFRTTLQNKKFSLMSNVNTILVFIFSVTGAYIFNAVGLVLFRYIAYILTIIIAIKILSSVREIFNSKMLSVSDIKEFLKFSIGSSFNNAISQLLFVIDIFLIGIIIVDANTVASYRTATLIPFALNFIPASIMIFVYPYFAKKSGDKQWFKQKYYQLTKYLFIVNIFITSVLVIFAPIIIELLFGKQYLDAVTNFRILSIGFFVAGTLRIPVGNLLFILKKVKFALNLSIITGVLNIFLGIILISKYGSLGASISTLFVLIFSALISTTYLLYLFKNDENKKTEILSGNIE